MMNRSTQILVAIFAVLTIVILATAPWANLSASTADALASLAVIGVLSELLAIHYKVGRTDAGTSLAFVPFLAAIVLIPPPGALLVAIITQTASHILSKRTTWKGVINLGQGIISVSAATAVFSVLGGQPGLVSTINPINFAALAFTFFLFNQVLVSIALAVIGGERWGAIFLKVIGKGGSNLLYDVLVSPLAAIVTLLFAEWGGPGVMIIVLPLLLIRHSYFSNQQLRVANRDLLRVLVKAIETRDPYTSGHSIRVATLARRIAEDMQLPPQKVEDIETAALVHDIGKVDLIYAELIRKQSSLSEAERHVIVTHAAKGAEFLKTLSTVKGDVIQGVRHHHERYDGSGYPDGLAGDAIPLPSRIIMVCDSVDAMLSDRPYRKALSIEQVRQELLNCAGSQFDPKIVTVMLNKNTLERAAESVPQAPEIPLSLAV